MSPEEAGWLLEGFFAGCQPRLPMGQGDSGQPKDKNGGKFGGGYVDENIEHPTSNIQHPTFGLRLWPKHSMFDVRCSMFDVSSFSILASLPRQRPPPAGARSAAWSTPPADDPQPSWKSPRTSKSQQPSIRLLFGWESNPLTA